MLDEQWNITLQGPCIHPILVHIDMHLYGFTRQIWITSNGRKVRHDLQKLRLTCELILDPAPPTTPNPILLFNPQ